MTDRDDTHELAERIASSVREQTAAERSSRRGFLGRSALAGGAILALGSASGFALAQEQSGEHDPDGGTEALFDDVHGTDVDVLNFALSLELLEAEFYSRAFDTFDEEDFVNADVLQPFSEAHRRQAFADVQQIFDNEATHAEVLTDVVDRLGGDPVEERSYEFPLGSVGEFLETAATIENTGTGAYAAAARFIESPDLLGSALSIHSVEARHAARLNTLIGEPPHPNAFDPAVSQEEAIAAVEPFIVGEGEEPGTPTETPTEQPTETATETPTPANETATPTGTPTEETATPTGTPLDETTDTPTGTPLNETDGT